MFLVLGGRVIGHGLARDLVSTFLEPHTRGRIAIGGDCRKSPLWKEAIAPRSQSRKAAV